MGSLSWINDKGYSDFLEAKKMISFSFPFLYILSLKREEEVQKIM